MGAGKLHRRNIERIYQHDIDTAYAQLAVVSRKGIAFSLWCAFLFQKVIPHFSMSSKRLDVCVCVCVCVYYVCIMCVCVCVCVCVYYVVQKGCNISGTKSRS